MNFDWISDDKDALIYIGDPLCSWCYGITQELDKLKTAHSDLDFYLVMGGLRPFNTETAFEMADFLKSHWIEIEERTGQPFSFDILSNETFIYDTEPPARAVIVCRFMNPSIELEFFKHVQTAFYKENKNTNEVGTYLQIASKFKLDVQKFEELYLSEQIKSQTKADFQLASDMGIRGFPSIVLKKDGQFSLIANGFDTAENISSRIKNIG